MKKFAILKQSDTSPLEVWEYIDDEKEARKYWYVAYAIDKYGLEDVLPICMNSVGGYHTLYKPWLVCIVEAEDFPTIATHKELFNYNINNPNFDYGWIDLQGNTYMCKYMMHVYLAEDLCKLFYQDEFQKFKEEHFNGPDDFLIKKGWIKVNNVGAGHAVLYDKTSIEALITLDKVESKKKGNCLV